jgi:hypothetical protein
MSVIKEKIEILQSELQEKEYQGLRILGCSKTYHIANNCCGTKEVNALKQVRKILLFIIRPISVFQLANYLLF